MTGQQISDVGLDVALDNVDRPMSRGSRLQLYLLAGWRTSILRILLEECYRFPLRIVMILRTPHLRWGIPIPPDPRGGDRASFRLENSFLLACTENMQDLRSRHVWLGTLESQICCQAFERGTLFGARNSGNESSTAVRHP